MHAQHAALTIPVGHQTRIEAWQTTEPPRTRLAADVLLLALGRVFLIGPTAYQVPRWTLHPPVTLLLLGGPAFGDAGFGVQAASLLDQAVEQGSA